MDIQLHAFLTSALDVGKRSVSRSGRSNSPRYEAPEPVWTLWRRIESLAPVMSLYQLSYLNKAVTLCAKETCSAMNAKCRKQTTALVFKSTFHQLPYSSVEALHNTPLHYATLHTFGEHLGIV
jgi:hypothetical protein